MLSFAEAKTHHNNMPRCETASGHIILMFLCFSKERLSQVENNPENRQTMAASRWRFKSTN
jgi:hypothetical protein